MNEIEKLLRAQIRELETLVALKNQRISELERQVAASVSIVSISNPLPTQRCIEGCDYPSPWMGIFPPACRKCGLPPAGNVTYRLASTSVVSAR